MSSESTSLEGRRDVSYDAGLTTGDDYMRGSGAEMAWQSCPMWGWESKPLILLPQPVIKCRPPPEGCDRRRGGSANWGNPREDWQMKPVRWQQPQQLRHKSFLEGAPDGTSECPPWIGFKIKAGSAHQESDADKEVHWQSSEAPWEIRRIRRMQQNSSGEAASAVRKKMSEYEVLEAKSSKSTTTITPTAVLGTT